MDMFLFCLVIIIILLLLALLAFVYFSSKGWNYPDRTEIRDGESGRMSDCSPRRIHLRVVYLERRVTELEQEIEELKKRLGNS